MKSVFNVGGWDRAARIVVGILMIVLAGSGLLGKYSVIGLYGLIPFATGVMKFCPFYSLFGFNTCKPPKKD